MVVNQRVEPSRASHWIAIAAAVAALAIGVWYGTDAAGGSDSACYLSEARMFARGTTRDPLPLARFAPWPNAVWSFTPAGHVPAPGDDAAIAPMCPPGLPLAMAALRLVHASEFLAVPIFGALAVYLAFVLGERVGGSTAGAASAVLTLCSPIFLYQLVQPMTDVPAAAWWLLVIVLAIGGERGAPRPLASGLAASMAILTRPNLAPLIVVVAVYLSLRSRPAFSYARGAPPPLDLRQAQVDPEPGRRVAGALRRAFTLAAGADSLSSRRPQALLFLTGAFPGIALLAFLQYRMYGSPFATGYGPAEAMFGATNLLPNLRRYGVWLSETHTPILALALVAPLVARARAEAWLCLALAAATVAAYLPYKVFDDWWYIRFLLPAIPLLIVLTVAAAAGLASRLAPRSGARVVAALAAVLASWWLYVAQERLVFVLHEWEHHFVEAGAYVNDRLPARAAVFTVKHSGAVYFYSERPIVTWNLIDPSWLDRAVAFLRDRGYTPYLLIDIEEEARFRARFGGASALGGLDWPPVARVGHAVRVYGLLDRARFLAGETIATEEVSSARPRRRRSR